MKHPGSPRQQRSLLKCRNRGLRRLVMAAGILALIFPNPKLARAQSNVPVGLYRIVSGNYTACCGIAGPIQSALPTPDQAFVRLAIDPQNGFWILSFLTEQTQTLFTVATCPPNPGVTFSFGYGFGFADGIEFHVDPGPPPENLYWSYSVSNSANPLRIDGQAGVSQGLCSDVPNRFTHSNVVAVLVSPRLSVTESSSEGPLLMVQGDAGRTNVLQASADLRSWVPLSTNVMPNTTCPVCPFFTFRDSAATNTSHRFYRVFSLY